MALQVTLFRTLGVSVIAVGIAACGGTETPEKKTETYDPDSSFSIAKFIGSTKNPPDEFAVISTAPLELPKDFTALPTPQPGARSPLVPDPVVEARQVLLGDTAPQAANARVSASESALLSATGPTTDPNIRTVLAAEQAETADDGYVLDRVFPALREYRGAGLEDTIRPSEERIRLSEASTAPRLNSDGIATIPSAPPSVIARPPSVTPTVPTAARPTSDSVTAGELIYIPE